MQHPALPLSCQVTVGDYRIRVPVASTAAQQYAGLRHGRSYAGMLFDPAPPALTMRGVSFGLQALVLESIGTGAYRVSDVLAMEPGVELYPISVGRSGVVLEATSMFPVRTGDRVSIDSCTRG